jgi:hypothetical protein
MPPIKTSKKMIKVLDQAEARQDLIAIAFDHAIELPINQWIKPEDWISQLEKYVDPSLFGTILQKELPIILEGWKKRAEGQRQTVKDFLNAEVQAELRFWAGSPLHLSSRQIQAWVNHPLTEHILTQLIKDTLERFISTIKPGGQGGGMIGSLGRTAFSLASTITSKTTKGLFSGLGDQFEDQFKELTTSFIQGSMHSVIQRLALLLSAPEVATSLGESRLELYENLLKKPISQLLAQAQDIDMALWAEMIPDLIQQQLNRDFVRQGILEEAQRLLDIYGDQPIKSYLGAQDKIEALKQRMLAQFEPQVSSFVKQPAFEEWLKKYFD